jgi:SAM-dependent methyltransferase
MKSDVELNQSLYTNRFIENIEFRKMMYRSLYLNFLSRYIPIESTVLEVGAGYCELINVIEANKKIAVDINPDIQKYADPSVITYVGSSVQLEMISDGTVDIAIANNFFEHLSWEEIIQTIKNIRRVLNKNGSLLVLQPNYRYCYQDYWMFFDHITPLDDRSMKEVLEANRFKVDVCYPKFLPYTMKSRLPKSIVLFNIYIKLPVLWRVFGKQFLIISRLG